ncbi:hypothetical protein AB751O23_BW_00030 [Chlamydiales bacterium SCGC AB-751-O23]|jgi:hypothetical protein|nr:hypothetical protein AB751O23_BW_00030 [Chlamydiales bacterium SCGC AB-751-O23]
MSTAINNRALLLGAFTTTTATVAALVSNREKVFNIFSSSLGYQEKEKEKFHNKIPNLEEINIEDILSDALDAFGEDVEVPELSGNQKNSTDKVVSDLMLALQGGVKKPQEQQVSEEVEVEVEENDYLYTYMEALKSAEEEMKREKQEKQDAFMLVLNNFISS